MRLRGTKFLIKTGRRIRSRFVKGALILGYHRISEDPHDYFSLSVSPSNFSEQLEVIREITVPTRLEHLVNEFQTGSMPRRTIAITLDDGYADNLYNAKPLLERYKIPASIFIVSGNLGKVFWWDELERLILDDEKFQPGRRLDFTSQQFSWSTKAGFYREQRKEFLLALYANMLPLTEEKREEEMGQLKEWIGGVSTLKKTHRALTRMELTTLTEDGLIDAGSHSLTHPMLASLNKEQQQFEIWNSKIQLEEMIARPVTGFSYPNGSVSPTTLTLVKEAGFAFACSSDEDVVWRGSHRYRLPRFWVPNWGRERFARWLTGLLKDK